MYLKTIALVVFFILNSKVGYCPFYPCLENRQVGTTRLFERFSQLKIQLNSDYQEQNTGLCGKAFYFISCKQY